MAVKRPMIRKFLEDAFTGESRAHMRYLIFAEQAEREGLPGVARLFRAIAYAEFVHARNHLRALEELGRTEDNLREAVAGEEFEVEEMYPVYKNASELQGEGDAVRSTRYALEAEKLHVDLYRNALESVRADNDVEAGKIYVCPVCGYTVVGERPDRCPVCGSPGEKFVAFE